MDRNVNYPFSILLVIFFDYCTFLVVITTSFEVVSRYFKANWLQCTENVQKMYRKCTEKRTVLLHKII